MRYSHAGMAHFKRKIMYVLKLNFHSTVMTLPLMHQEREPPLGNIAFNEEAFSDWIDRKELEVFQNVSKIGLHTLNRLLPHMKCVVSFQTNLVKTEISQRLSYKQEK